MNVFSLSKFTFKYSKLCMKRKDRSNMFLSSKKLQKREFNFCKLKKVEKHGFNFFKFKEAQKI